MISIHTNNHPGKRGYRPGRGYTRRMAKSFDFQHAPGHLIRRAHQLAVAIFMEETGDFDITPELHGSSQYKSHRTNACRSGTVDDGPRERRALSALGRPSPVG